MILLTNLFHYVLIHTWNLSGQICMVSPLFKFCGDSDIAVSMIIIILWVAIIIYGLVEHIGYIMKNNKSVLILSIDSQQEIYHINSCYDNQQMTNKN